MKQLMSYMKRILSLFALLLVSVIGFAQAPSNYTNINGRYRWIAGMFDSTFSLPKGTIPSLRTGGSTNGGALFYRTSDSTVKYWTGTQWLTLSDSTRYVPYVGAIKDVDLDTWSLNAKSLHVKGTAGNGHVGLKFQSATPNMSANESGLYADASGNLGVKIDNAHTSIFKTSLNSADRTYTFQNKSYTLGDSTDIAARVKYTDTTFMLDPYFHMAGVGLKTSPQLVYADTLLLSTRAWRQKGIDSVASLANSKINGTLISGYLTKATGTNTIDTSQIYQSSGNIGIGTTTITSGYKVDMIGSLRVGNGSSSNKLTINGNTVGSYLRFQKNGTNKGDIGPFSAVIGGVAPYGGSDDDLSYSSVGGHFFNTNAGIKMYLSNAGNLGLSTTPDSMLTILEGAYFQRGVRMSGLPTGVGTKALRVDANGTVSIADTLANGISGSGTTNYIPKFTSSSAIGNSVMYEGSSNIGIGTTSPDYQLTVSKASDTYIKVANTASSITAFYGVSNTGGYVGTGTNHPILFVPNGTTRMTLDASGNLGLGVTPSAWGSAFKAMQINAGGAIWGSTNVTEVNLGGNTRVDVNNAQYDYISTGGASQYQQSGGQHIWKTAPSGTAGTAISFTQAMTLFSTGNLAVGGTSDNGSRLNVTGAATFSSSVTANAASTINGAYPQLILNNPSAGAGIELHFKDNGTLKSKIGTLDDINSWQVYNGGAIRFTINNSGNVGIGTSSPRERLDVNGNIVTAWGGDYFIGTEYLDGADYQNGLLVNGNQRSTGIIAKGASGSTPYIWFGTGITPTERMRITSGGELLINTTTDLGDYKLQISGNALLTGTINTGAPTGDTSTPWKLGSVSTVSPTSPNRTIRVEINGVVYYIAAKTTND